MSKNLHTTSLHLMAMCLASMPPIQVHVRESRLTMYERFGATHVPSRIGPGGGSKSGNWKNRKAKREKYRKSR